MNPPSRILGSALAATVACLSLAGCLNLKPSRVTARHFVLAALPATAAPPTPGAQPSLAVGIGPVKLPGYLFNSAVVVRASPTEVTYLPDDYWAERLDNGFQRVLAANLSTLLGTDQIRLSDWRPTDVAVEVYVAIERFDVDANGGASLLAWWRVLAPGGTRVLRAGETRLEKSGPAPAADARGATATLSELAAGLSGQVARAIQESIPAPVP